MPEVSLNLGKKQITMVPTGNYLCEVRKVEAKKAKSGAPMIVVNYSLLAPETYSACRPQYHNLVLGEKNMWALEFFLRGIELPVPETDAERESYKLNTDDWVGRRFIGHLVEQPTYQNNALEAVRPANSPNIELGPENLSVATA